MPSNDQPGMTPEARDNRPPGAARIGELIELRLVEKELEKREEIQADQREHIGAHEIRDAAVKVEKKRDRDTGTRTPRGIPREFRRQVAVEQQTRREQSKEGQNGPARGSSLERLVGGILLAGIRGGRPCAVPDGEGMSAFRSGKGHARKVTKQRR